MNIILPDQYIGMRIDKALSEYFGLSRNFFHNLFERKLVKYYSSIVSELDSSKVIKKSHILQGGEEFILPELERYADNQIMNESPIIDLEIKHKTSDYLVLYKPKGVLSHPKTLFDVKEASVSGFLYHKFGHLPSMEGFVRGGIVHRLDKDTDGLMIVALSERGLKYFRELFDRKANRLMNENAKMSYNDFDGLHKYYCATCEITKKGQKWLEKNKQFPMILDSMIYPKTNTIGYPKKGVTIIRNIGNSVAIKLGDSAAIQLDLEIITGRTHQIRYQLAEIGLPIVGDGLYGSAYGALQLTAYKLDFVDPDGERVVAEL